ncbi:hypothetical protein, partial [Streptomyces sp. NPDC055509]
MAKTRCTVPEQDRRRLNRLQTRVGLPGQAHGDVPEVDLCFLPGTVGLRHEHLRAAVSGLGPDLTRAHRDISADHAIGDPVRVMLVDQPVEDTLGG